MAPCAECQTTNPEHARFCLGCGTPLAPADEIDRRKLVTVLFFDLVGSTALAEHLDPEALRSIVDEYFREMRAIIERHGGMVEKFIGDAVVAVFGLPVVHEDDATRAARAAIEMRRRLAELNEKWREEPGVVLEARGGLHTGEVVARGGAASGGQAYVTGDVVNTAARLQQAAGPGDILIGRPTLRAVGASLDAEAVAQVSAKGKSTPISAYRLLGVSSTAPELPPPAQPFVGRAEELAALGAALRISDTMRSARLITVVGEPGIGKSRLVAEALRSSSEARVLRGRCLPYGEGITYWPVREIVYAAAGISEADDRSTARRKVSAAVGQRLASSPDASGSTGGEAETIASRLTQAVGLADGTAEQDEIFWAARRFLESAARERPLVVVVDDLQWAEPTLFELIEHVAEHVQDVPLTLLCVARPELEFARPSWLDEIEPTRRVLRLLPLPQEATEALLAGWPAMPSAVRRQIMDRAGGNPLFVEELLGMLRDEAALLPEGSPIPSLEQLAVPATIQGLIQARLDRLPSADRAVLEAGAVVGRVFDEATVRHLAASSAADGVSEHLAVLIQRGLIRPDPAAGRGYFRFHHLLVRDTTYAALPKSQRAILHERFARWLETGAGQDRRGPIEIIGHHLEQAHGLLSDLGRRSASASLGRDAAGYLFRAGRAAYGRGDLPAAENLFGRAARLTDDAERSATALLLIGRVQGDRGDFSAARETLVQAAQAARAARSDCLAARGDVELVRIDNFAGEAGWVSRSWPVLRRAAEVLATCRDDEGLAAYYQTEGTMLMNEGRLAEAATAFEKAISHSQQVADDLLRPQLEMERTRVLYLGNLPPEENMQKLAEWCTEKSTASLLHAVHLATRSRCLSMLGRFAEAQDSARLSMAIASELGDPLSAAIFESQILTEALALAGELDAAALAGRSGCATLRELGERMVLSTSAALLGEIELARRDAMAGQAWFDVGLASLEEEDVDAFVRLHLLRAGLSARAGNWLAAHEAAGVARERALATEFLLLHAAAFERLGEIYLLAGDQKAAVEQLSAAAAVHDQKGDIARALRVRTLRDAGKDGTTHPLI